MNKDQAKGRWDQVKGAARKIWAEIRGNDLKKAASEVQTLHGAIQEKVGDAKEAIKENIDKLQQNQP